MVVWRHAGLCPSRSRGAEKTPRFDVGGEVLALGFSVSGDTSGEETNLRHDGGKNTVLLTLGIF